MKVASAVVQTRKDDETTSTKLFTNYARTVGLNIQFYRKNCKLTQEQLAGIAKTSTAYISNLERGINNPTLEVLSRIAQALQVTPAELLDRSIYLERADRLSCTLNLIDSLEKLQFSPLALQRALAVILNYFPK